MKKNIVFISVLTITILCLIVLIFKLNKKNNEIINLKNKIEKDSISHKKAFSLNKNAFCFNKISLDAKPDRNIIPIGDSLKAHLLICVIEQIIEGINVSKPILLLGSDLDTINDKLIGPIDTVKQNTWDPIITRKTNKLGKDSISGMLYLKSSIKNDNTLMGLSFKFYYYVVEKEKYENLLKKTKR